MFLVKFLWLISMVIYLAALLLTQLFMPLGVNIPLGNGFLSGLQMGQETYFWVGVVVILFINGLLQMLGNLSLQLPTSLIPKGKYWMSEKHLCKQFKKNYKRWIKGLALVINLFLSAFLVFIYELTDSDFEMDMTYWFVFFGVLGLSWIVFFFVWFNDTKGKLVKA
ncbi:MAG: hypothetical protein AAF740_07785 [Bacteroidota bacterium]